MQDLRFRWMTSLLSSLQGLSGGKASNLQFSKLAEVSAIRA